ncbi:MAG: hypothetical protein V3R93_03480, partial [Candidatus Hydrothermarchaeaceae archaeon]
MRGVRVPARDAQSVKKTLIERGVLDTGKKALRDGDSVIFPVRADVEGFETVEAEFKDARKHGKFMDA